MDADTAFDICTGVCYCGHSDTNHQRRYVGCTQCNCDEYIERFKDSKWTV